jgi:hypothetical protein
MDLVNRKKVSALYESDYDEAARLEELASLIVTGEAGEIRKRCESNRRSELSMRYTELQSHQEEEQCRWRALLSESEREHRKQAQILQEQHGREVEEFKANWQDPEYVRQFHRPSVRLLQFRHIERKLVLQKKYSEAKGIKKIADEIQAEEEFTAQRHLEERMQVDFGKLREKHRMEFRKLDEFYGSSQTEIRLRMKKALDTLASALKAFEGKKNSPMTNRQYVHYRKVTATPLAQPCSTIPTPRTAERFTQFRLGPPGPLNVEPMDEERISQLSTPVRRQRTVLTPKRKERSLPRL